MDVKYRIVCGVEIDPLRLNALPTTKYCINHSNVNRVVNIKDYVLRVGRAVASAAARDWCVAQLCITVVL